MKHAPRAALCLAALLAGTLAWGVCSGEPVRYVLDARHSWVQFEVMHFGTSTVRGRLGPASGFVMLDRAAGLGSASIEIATASVSTGLAPFDQRIRRPDLLDTGAHPTAWFVSRALRLEGERLVSLRGELTLRGTSQGLTLTATHFGCHLEPQSQREVCGGDFEADLKRSDFGIDYGLPLIGDTVRLKVQVEGVRVEP